MFFNKKRPELLFEERQSQPLYIRIGLPVAMAAFTIPVYIFDTEQELGLLGYAIVTATVVIIAISLTQFKLITKVDSEKVSLRQRLLIHTETSLDTISKVEARSYKDAAKEHGTMALRASVYFYYIHDTGVLIHLYEGNPTFVSSRRAEELTAAINDACEKFEQAKYM